LIFNNTNYQVSVYLVFQHSFLYYLFLVGLASAVGGDWLVTCCT